MMMDLSNFVRIQVNIIRISSITGISRQYLDPKKSDLLRRMVDFYATCKKYYVKMPLIRENGHYALLPPDYDCLTDEDPSVLSLDPGNAMEIILPDELNTAWKESSDNQKAFFKMQATQDYLTMSHQ
jgi:hypothetical protein